nr:unnamed protein product [Callosobruchus analis]
MLTQTYKQPKIYNKLILAGPSLFDHREDALNMCRFISLILVTTVDDEVFRATCTYLDNLLGKWKDDPAVFGAVFSDVRVVRFLLIKMKYVCEDTVDLKLSINLNAALSGSELKTSKAMDILHLIMNDEDTFFRMDEKLIESVVFRLFDLCKQQEIECKLHFHSYVLFNLDIVPFERISAKCLRCLSVMMKAHKWLAFKSATNVFVETKCLSTIEGRSCAQFVAFLYVWLNSLRAGKATQVGHVAHEGIVSNYLKRVDILIRLRESKVSGISYYLFRSFIIVKFHIG